MKFCALLGIVCCLGLSCSERGATDQDGASQPSLPSVADIPIPPKSPPPPDIADTSQPRRVGSQIVLFQYSSTEQNGVTTTWEFLIEESRLSQLPKLDSRLPNPPVTIGQAVKRARRDVQDVFPGAGSLDQIYHLKLMQEQYMTHPKPVWIYEIAFYGAPVDELVPVYSSYICMDGEPLDRISDRER